MDSRLDCRRTDECISSVCMIIVSATYDERDEVDLLVAHRSRILQHDRAALCRTSEIEGRVTEWHAFRAVQSTPVQRRPIRCGASDEGILWRQKRLCSREECEADDVARRKDNEQPWAGQWTCGTNEGGV